MNCHHPLPLSHWFQAQRLPKTKPKNLANAKRGRERGDMLSTPSGPCPLQGLTKWWTLQNKGKKEFRFCIVWNLRNEQDKRVYGSPWSLIMFCKPAFMGKYIPSYIIIHRQLWGTIYFLVWPVHISFLNKGLLVPGLNLGVQLLWQDLGTIQGSRSEIPLETLALQK